MQSDWTYAFGISESLFITHHKPSNIREMGSSHQIRTDDVTPSSGVCQPGQSRLHCCVVSIRVTIPSHMKVSAPNTLRQPRMIFALIMLLLFARTAFAFHDSLHANLPDDQCQIAQLAQNTISTVPPSVAMLALDFSTEVRPEFIPQLIPRIGFRHLSIRAPPAHSC